MAYECGATFKIKDEVSSNMRTIKSSLTDCRSGITDFKSYLGGLNGYFREHKGNADNSSRSNRNFNSSCNGGQIDALTNKVKSLAKSYLGIKSAVNFAKSALTGGMEFENMRNTLNVVMKDSKLAGAKFREAVEFANATPFDTKEIVGGFVKLESYGVKTTKEVTTAVGDMAGVMNKSFDQAVEAVADAQTGELERLKEFGITKQQIIDHGNKIMGDKELVNNKGQITDQEAFNQTLMSLMKERFKGGMELQSKTLSGSISTMKGVIGNTMAQLAGVTEDGMVQSGGAVDILKNKVLKVTEVIQKWAADGGLKKVTDGMQQGFKKAGQAVQFCKQHADIIIPTLKIVVAGFAAFKTIKTVTNVFKTVTSGVKTMITAFKKVQGAIRFVHSAFNLLNPVTLIIAGIIIVGILLYKNWDKIKAKAHELHAKVSEKWNAIKEACEPVTSFIKEKWEEVKVKWEIIKLACSIFVESVKEKWNSLKEKCNTVVDGIKERWNSITETFNNVKERCGEFVADIKEKWNTITTVLANPIQATVSFVKNGDLSGVNTVAKIPGHKTGLTRVPFDGYRAELHEGERVLTKRETDLLDQGKLGGNIGNAPTINLNIANMNVREEADINKIAKALADMVRIDALNYAH